MQQLGKVIRDAARDDRAATQVTTTLGRLGAHEVAGHLVAANYFAVFGQFEPLGDGFSAFLLGHSFSCGLGPNEMGRK